MPRAVIFLILLVIVVVGLLWFLSGRAGDVPTRTIEVEVNSPANAR
jgi:lipopolysaccharide export system protein LptC